MTTNNVKVVFDRVAFNGDMAECASYEIYLSNTEKSGFLGSGAELSFSGVMSVESMNKITIALDKYKNKQLTIDEVGCILKEIGFEEVIQ